MPANRHCRGGPSGALCAKDEASASCTEAHMPAQYNDVKLLLDGNRINSLTVGELREICSQFDAPLRNFDYGFEVPSIGLSVYSHEYESDDSMVDAVSVVVPA